MTVSRAIVLLAQLSQQTDPACVISVDCARGFALLHLLNLRYGLYCFVFYGCIVVYSVPHKSVLTRKLIWPMSPMVCTSKLRVHNMLLRSRFPAHFSPLIPPSRPFSLRKSRSHPLCKEVFALIINLLNNN